MNNYKTENTTFELKNGRIIFSDEKFIGLTLAESKILETFFINDGVIISNQTLEDAGWDGKPVSSSALSVTLTSLRKKLIIDKSFEIKNFSKKGYKLLSDFTIEIIPNDTVDLNERVENNNTGVKIDMVTSKKNIFLNTMLILPLIFTFILYLYMRVSFECNNVDDKLFCYTENASFSLLNVMTDIQGNSDTVIISNKDVILR